MLELLESRRLFSISLDQGTLTIVGTPEADTIDVIKIDDSQGVRLFVRNGEETATYLDDQVFRIVIDAKGGNDYVTVERVNDLRPATVLGGAGNDILSGSAGADFLHGGTGRDQLWGGSGDDTLLGGRHNDTLIGGNGDDNLKGSFNTDVAHIGAGQDIRRDVETVR